MSLNPTRRSARTRSLLTRRPRYQPGLEALEARLVLSTIVWSGKGDGTTFMQGTNWTNNVAPGPNDDASITTLDSNIQISGSVTVNSITQTSGNLTVASGTLKTTSGTTIINASSFTDSKNAAISGGVTLINTATLNDSATDSASFTIEENSTLVGTVSLGQLVAVQGNSTYGDSALSLANGDTNAGTIQLQSASGSNNRSNLKVASGSTFVNTGTLSVIASNNASNLTGGTFDNQGTVNVAGAATLVVSLPSLSFIQDSGKLTATGSFIQTAGILDINGGAVTGNVDVEGASIDLASTITSATTVTAFGGNGNNTILANDSTMGTIIVQGNNTYGDSIGLVGVQPDPGNVGTIVLQSAGGSNNRSNLVVASGSTYVNTGTLNVVASNNPSNLTGGIFDNKGTVNVAGAASLVVNLPSLSFIQDSGKLTATGVFIQDFGTLAINGGTVTGNVDVEGASINLASTITSATTVTALGGNGNSPLVANDSTMGTVIVQGNNNYGDSNLLLMPDPGDVGTIVLQSAGGSNNRSNLVVASGSTYVNTGTLNVVASNNPSNLTGGIFDNKGTVNVAGAASLVVNLPSLSFIQDSGKLTATGVFIQDFGTLAINGGAVTGNVDVEGASINLASTITSATIVTALGGNNNTTLVANDSTMGTIIVQGNNNYGDSNLLLMPDPGDSGTIVLQSAGGSNNRSNLVVASGTSYTNQGTIDVNASNNASNLTGGSFDNQGTITIAGGASLVVNLPNLTFTQDAGTLSANGGTFVCIAGTLTVNGGAVTGAIDAEGCSFQISHSITSPTTIFAIGGGNNSDITTLISNDSTMGTVDVEGGINGNNSNLSVSSTTHNVGTIVLQSITGSSDRSNLVVASSSTFINTGTFTVNASVNPSNLTGGNFDNKGAFNVAGGGTLYVTLPSLTFTQDSGSLSAVGPFICNAGMLTVNGGTVTGNVEAEGSSLLLASSITLPTLVYAIGGGNNSNLTTLVSNDSTKGTVDVEGGVGGNDSNLSLSPTTHNVGTIVLQSTTGSGARSNLVVASGSGTFTNTGTITVNVSNNASNLTGGNFDNQGTINVSGGATLFVGSAGSVFTQDSGAIKAIGAFICNAGMLTINGGTLGLVEAEGSMLTLSASITAPTLVYAIGGNGNTTLLNNSSALGTVDVEGGVNGLDSNLALDPAAHNLGTIVLQSLAGNNAHSNLAVASGSTFVNAGTLTVNPSNAASILTGNFSNSGTINLNGASLTLASAGTSLVNLAGGTINASGTLNDTATGFTNMGTLSVDTGTAATLNITGTYTQTSGGALDFELGGLTAGSQFDQLNVTGAANLAGSVNLALLNGFSPANGNSFKIMTFASASGMFATYNGTNLLNGLYLQQSQTTTAVTLTVMPSPKADLSVTVIAQPANLTLGGSITYSVTVTNLNIAGSSNAQGIILTDVLPANDMAGFTITSAPYTYTLSGNVVTVNIPTMTVGASYTLTIMTTPTAIGSYKDSATVSSTISYDGNSSNNSSSATSTVVPQNADLGVMVAASPTQTTLGNNLTYSVTLNNSGPNDAQAVVISDTLPANVTFVSASDGQGDTVTRSGNTVTLNVATVVNNETITLTIIVTPNSTGTFVDSATATEGSPGDPNLSNNTGSASATVVGQAFSVTTAGNTSPQTAVVNTNFGSNLQALVEDQSGDFLSGVIVTFTATGTTANGSFAGSATTTALTNSAGIATAPAFTANTIVGSYVVTAMVSGVASPASFALNNTPGAASTIMATSGTPQGAVVGTTFATAFSATVKDQFGNLVPNVVVTFAAPNSGVGGNFAGSRTTTATTNAQGVATAPSFTAGTAVGSYLVTANVAGVGSSATYSLSNTFGAASTIAATAGTPQTTVVGTAFASPLTATVDDQYGNPVSGVVVTFAAPTNSGASGTFAGSLTTTVTTNANGQATSPTFTADATSGNFVVTATAPGVASPASFALNNSLGVASTILATAGTPQGAVVGTNFATALSATVEDQFGNPISGVVVTFTSPGSRPSGNFSGSRTVMVTTNAQGVATAPTLTAGTLVGSYQVTASVFGVTSSAIYNLTNTIGAASSIVTTSGTPQTTVVGTPFASPLQATVDDQYGNPVAGVIVTFAAPTLGADGNFAGSSTVTEISNANGLVTAPNFTAGIIAGSYQVQASVSGLSGVASFVLTNIPGSATSVIATAGTPQTTVVGQNFAAAMQATVDDQYGNPVAGVIVTFTAPIGGASGTFAGSNSSAAATTNAQGIATAPVFRAGTIVGSFAVVASIAGVSSGAAYNLTDTPGMASSISTASGTPQTATVNTAFASALQATVVDQYGNPVAGVVVTFAAPTSGADGSFAGTSTVTATTAANGMATAPAFTAGTSSGSYAVQASVASLSGVASFLLTNTPGTATSIIATAGTPQAAVVNSTFARALQATADDKFGNPVAGLVVTFTAPGSGVGGTFVGGKATVTATTNAQGVATTVAFTADSIAGSYSVIASATGLTSTASFTLTNTAGSVSSVIATAGTPQTAAVNSPFAVPFQVTVEDQFGNLIAGAVVTFTAPTTSVTGTFAGSRTATATTNAQGVATAPSFTANTLAGRYIVTASTSVAASVATFVLTNTPAVASSITATAGTPQAALVGAIFTTPLQATVADKYGNPIAGIVVTFIAPSGLQASGSFAGSQTATATTNAQGIATAPALTAGNLVGSFVVHATALNVSSSASFSLSVDANTTTTLVVQPTRTAIGKPVTLTAAVSATAPASTMPTGTVNFYDGTRLLGTATLDGTGHATLVTTFSTSGIQSITAQYAGNGFDFMSTSAATPIRVGSTTPGDYDGDGKSDVAVYDQTTATFTINYSGGGTRTQQLGNTAHVNTPIAGDFDGDGKTDLAIFDQTLDIFYVLESGGGTIAQQLGNTAHVNIPFAADFDGDGKTDLAIFDQTASIVYALESGGGTIAQQFGNATHVNIPVAGDFDGDGKTDLAVYDETAATFFVAYSTGGGKGRVQSLGNATHYNIPIAADFDGDGKTDLAIYDQTAGILYSLESGGGTIALGFGNPGVTNIPVLGDFDGDGKSDIAIYDQTDAEYLVIESAGGSIAQLLGNKKHLNFPV